jgi:hypothetical protein
MMKLRGLPLLAALVLLAAGCGGESYKTAPVSGRVTLKGQALAKASVVFQPEGDKNNPTPGPGSSGKTDADGHYTLKITGKETEGAVVGKHKVRIWLTYEDNPADDRPKRHKQLPPEYNAKTKLEFDVPADGTDKANFDLK